MRTTKLAYKNAIKAYQMEEDSYFTNDLHELLLVKDMFNFWKSWNSKMVKPKQAAFPQKFATHIQVSSNLATDYSHHNNNNTGKC